ncbi:MAG: hypothetical protein AAB649_01880, partial [Patescibacteria group bacterium]
VEGVEFGDPAHTAFIAYIYYREGRFQDALYWYDQAYQGSKDVNIRRQRDQLAEKTGVLVPKSLQEIRKYNTYSSSTSP